MPPIQDSGPSCHRSREVRSIRYFISAESCPQPRETMPQWRRRPWLSSGQSWSCGVLSPRPKVHPGHRPHAPTVDGPRQGHQRQGDSLVLALQDFHFSCITGPEPRTPTQTASLGSGQLSQVCQGSLPTHPQFLPYCLTSPTGPGRRLGGGV